MPPTSEKRVRGPTSCAECRRLKLKCDKRTPCSSCLRRGCASICPHGHMVPRGNRFVLANTEELHAKIDALISRVHQLEAALEILHSDCSHEPHPLLVEELRRVAIPIDPGVPAPGPVLEEEELAGSAGTLTLNAHGSRHFGHTGAFAYLWDNSEGPDGPGIDNKGAISLVLSELPPELAHMAHAFPVRLDTGDTTHLSTWILENCLPPFSEAWSLFESYWEYYATWHFTPFTRAGFVEQILSPLYRRSPDNGAIPLGHRLASLFMVFAIGEIMDLTQPLRPSNGLRYYLLSRASLALDPVFESPTVTALQAMALMSSHIQLLRITYEPEHAWVLSGINSRLALTLGLQHDANKFNLPAVEVEARQHLLVSILCHEVWQALHLGRPPCFTFAHFDLIFSKQPESATHGAPISSQQWSANFVRDCVSKVLDTVVGSKSTTYHAIMQLDTKVRKYPDFIWPSDGSEDMNEDHSAGRIIQRAFTGFLKDVCLIYLHRRFFAIALRDAPEDLLKSQFAVSVLACYHSAARFRSQWDAVHSALPAISQRLRFIWPTLFAATMILGSIVARSPASSLASPAFKALEEACQLWEGNSESICGPNVLATVRKLRHKASTAFSQRKAPKGPLGVSPGGVEVSDEIHALGGGGPRVISSTLRQSAMLSPLSYPPEHTASGAPSRTLSSASTSQEYDTMHPSIPESHESERSLVMGAFLDVSNPSMAPPFDFAYIDPDFSSHFPEFMPGTLPSTFDEIFQNEARTTHSVPVGSSVLEELGLGGEWQPVMDELNL